MILTSPTPLFGPGAYRFLLASLVVVHHFSSLALGPAAVFIFFNLSGYWMSRVWEEKYSRMPSGYITYVKARFWRLLPLFWAASLFTACVFLLTGVRADMILRGDWSEPRFWLELLPHVFILGYNQLHFRPLVPAWSLDVEIQFYICLPLLLMVLQRLGWRFGMVLFAIVALASARWLGSQNLMTNLVFFSMGASFYLSSWRPSERLARISILLAVTVCACCLFVPALKGSLLGGANAGPNHHLLNTALSVLLACLLLPFTLQTVFLPSSEKDQILGDLSYSLYLFHSPLSIVVGNWYGNLAARQRLIYVAAGIITSIVVAYLAWKFIDKPAQDARKRRLLSNLIGQQP